MTTYELLLEFYKLTKIILTSQNEDEIAQAEVKQSEVERQLEMILGY